MGRTDDFKYVGSLLKQCITVTKLDHDPIGSGSFLRLVLHEINAWFVSQINACICTISE